MISRLAARKFALRFPKQSRGFSTQTLRAVQTVDKFFNGPRLDEPMVFGHRSGFKHANLLDGFAQSKAHKLAGVELDIWLTTDNELVVYHGGLNGEFHGHPELPKITDLTLDEARDAFKSEAPSPDLTLPTLDEVVELLWPEVAINIELKSPADPHQLATYKKDQRVAKQVLQKVIKEYPSIDGVHFSKGAFFSSFDHSLLREFDEVLKGMDTKQTMNSLYLAWSVDYGSLLPEEAFTDWGQGVNIDTAILNKEIVSKFHKNGKLVASWVDAEVVTHEDESFWNWQADIGLEMITTDYPLQVLETLKKRKQKQAMGMNA